MNQSFNKVKDISFNLPGTLSAECNSTNDIIINSKDNQNSWGMSISISSKDQCDHFCRSKWALPQFGPVLAASSLDRTVAIFGYSKVSLSESAWIQSATIASDTKIEGFDFIGNTNDLKLVMVTQSGQAMVYESTDLLHKKWDCIWKAQVASNTCTCVSTLKTDGFSEYFVIGSLQSLTDNKEPTIKVYAFNQKKKEYYLLATMKNMCGSAMDVQWGYQLGKEYHYIAYTEMNRTISFSKITMKLDPKTMGINATMTLVNAIEHDSVIKSINWNYIGTMVTGIDEFGVPLKFIRESDGEKFIMNILNK